MKKSIFTKIGAAAVALTLVTSSLVGGTFAKYTTTTSGKATATVAKWNVKLTDGTNEYTDSNKIALEGSGTNKTVAPGDSGTFDLVVDATGTQVDVEYVFTMPDMTNSVIQFYKSDGSAITADDLKGTISKDATDADKKVEKTIKWEWKQDNDNDAADTAKGVAATGTAEEFEISLTASQVVATTPVQ